MGTSPLSLHHPPPLLLLLRLLLLPFVTTQTILNITNRCSYTVWPAALPMGGGMRLDSGKTWTLQVPSDTRGGSVWARTGCSFDGKGRGSCQTGDCEGLLACKIDGLQRTHGVLANAGQGARGIRVQKGVPLWGQHHVTVSERAQGTGRLQQRMYSVPGAE